MKKGDKVILYGKTGQIEDVGILLQKISEENDIEIWEIRVNGYRIIKEFKKEWRK